MVAWYASSNFYVGITLILIGMLFLLGGITKTNNPVYNFFAHRPRMMVGEEGKHKAMIMFGVLMTTFGILVSVRTISMKS